MRASIGFFIRSAPILGGVICRDAHALHPTQHAVYANGAQDISDSVLGVQIIDGTGVLLNFGGQVIKNVAGYDNLRNWRACFYRHHQLLCIIFYDA
jgi:FAD/FMN-containing dehydrogenase